MGCWNQTCAISNLPIFAGNEVVALVLTDATNGRDTLSISRYHIPMAFYFEGEYDDYGGVDEESGEMIPYLLEAIRRELVELNDDELHGDKLSRAEFNYEQFITSAERGRLYVYLQGKKTKVSHIQIHKSVFDNVIERYSFEYHDRQSSNYKVATFNTIMASFTEWFSKTIANPNTIHMDWDLSDTELGDLLRRDNYTSRCPLLSVPQILFECKKKFSKGEITSDQIYAIIENIVKMQLLKGFLTDAGRHLTVPGHIGQESSTTAQELLASLIIEKAEEIHTRSDEWDEE